ncbi:MAG TPA: hypothetical protein VJ124_24770 [Pyrinomonadaceae bacterium]|nr:hypothetical protein [Pyrinomonadaceae bacterium]
MFRIPDSDLNPSSTNSDTGIRPGVAIIIVLHTPREKCWGLLDEISPAGVFLRGLDLNSFDDWVQAVAHDEPFVGLGDLFFPMWRIERIAKDESAGGISPLHEQAETRTGRTLADIFQRQS